MKVLWVFFGVVMTANADYHDSVGIRLAANIKKAEDKYFDQVPTMESRVVGGEIAPVAKYPFLVGLLIDLDIGLHSVCGSSLVTATRLVTAAHCMRRATSMTAVLGSQHLYHGGTRLKTNVFVAHPDFDMSRNLDNDIAVVYLPQPVKYSATIQPISLPTENDVVFVGEWATAVGWGKYADSQYFIPSSTQVREVRLKLISEEECEKSFGAAVLYKLTVCTSGQGAVGTCGGDSGGPLVIEKNGRLVLIGLTSFGTDLCEIGEPSVFTRVDIYLDFIYKHL